jgi:hypothetical protein
MSATPDLARGRRRTADVMHPLRAVARGFSRKREVVAREAVGLRQTALSAIITPTGVKVTKIAVNA